MLLLVGDGLFGAPAPTTARRRAIGATRSSACEKQTSPREQRAKVGSHRRRQRTHAWMKASRSAERRGGIGQDHLDSDRAVREGKASKGDAPVRMARQAMGIRRLVTPSRIRVAAATPHTRRPQVNAEDTVQTELRKAFPQDSGPTHGLLDHPWQRRPALRSAEAMP
jgi:hypothetical protein